MAHRVAGQPVHLNRDDAVALPSGCQGQGLITGYCSNGDYSLYDLRRKNDKRSITTKQALLQGSFATGNVQHELSTGVSTLNRQDKFADYVFNYVGEGNIYNPVYYDFALPGVNPVSLRRKDEERAVFVQDIMALTEQLKLHAGVRYVQLKRDQYNSSGALTRQTDDNFVLPNVALVYSPQPTLSVYGSYAQGLEPGGEAPTGTTNAEVIMDLTSPDSWSWASKPMSPRISACRRRFSRSSVRMNMWMPVQLMSWQASRSTVVLSLQHRAV